MKLFLSLFVSITLLGCFAVCHAFQRVDGTIVTCRVAGPNGTSDAIEQMVPPGSLGYAGFTRQLPNGQWLIQFDPMVLQQYYVKLPVEVDLVFYHECSHAQLPTSNEIMANCRAVNIMRQEGLLDASKEQALAVFHQNLGPLPPQYGGSGAAFWQATMQCVNAGGPTIPAPTPAVTFPHFCCTPTGRFGPFPNTTILRGQQCFASTPWGQVFGAACD